jgi:hypothetical protein
MPMMAFIGVRSSCDMLARNEVLVRLAASAAARASCMACSVALRAEMSVSTAQNSGSPSQACPDAGSVGKPPSSAITLTSASKALPSARWKRHSNDCTRSWVPKWRRMSSSARSRLGRPSACTGGDMPGNHGTRPRSWPASAAPNMRTVAGLQCVTPRRRSKKR